MKTWMLSPLEKTCLRWVSQGRTPAEIASLLGKSNVEIERYLERALVSLEVESIEDAIEKANLFKSN